MKPPIQFAKREDGVKIAYSKFGKGQLLVLPPPWTTSLRFIVEDPHMNHFMEQLAQRVTVVFYDKHGCGQSDRDRETFTLESDLLDLETVVNHLGLDKFNLFGSSMSGPLSLAFTARYPEKVKRLVLYATFANGTKLAPKKVQLAIISLIEASWGLGSKALADVFNPNADAEILQSHARYQRVSSSPEIAAKLLQLCYSIDVTDTLSSIKIPTLILHREDDKAVPIQHGRELSSEIFNSMFKILNGNEHPMWYGESDKIVEEILDFLNERAPTSSVDQDENLVGEDSDLAEQTTIVFTDIVSSTDLVTQGSDVSARDIFLKHDKLIRNLLKRYGGKELQNLGDGFMLSFSSASSAIKFACKIQQQILEHLHSIQVRIGINTGEIVRREGKHPFGQAVILASRIVSECKGGDILVSDVTKQLTAGSGFSFIEKPAFQPKGFSNSIKLFEVSCAK